MKIKTNFKGVYMKMKKGMVFLTVMLIAVNALAFKVVSSAGVVLGQAAEVKCSINLPCQVNGNQMSFSATSQVTASASATITASQCGMTFKNSAAATLKLPEASTVIGCRLTFFVANASNFDIDPNDGTDQILMYTNAAGDAIRSATLGNSITLTAIANDLWAPQAIASGTAVWSDIN